MSIVIVLTRRSPQMDSRIVGAFTLFVTAAEAATSLDALPGAQVATDYLVGVCLLDGRLVEQYFRLPDGGWISESGMTVDPKAIDAEWTRRAYVSAGGDMQVNHDTGAF